MSGKVFKKFEKLLKFFLYKKYVRNIVDYLIYVPLV